MPKPMSEIGLRVIEQAKAGVLPQTIHQQLLAEGHDIRYGYVSSTISRARRQGEFSHFYVKGKGNVWHLSETRHGASNSRRIHNMCDNRGMRVGPCISHVFTDMDDDAVIFAIQCAKREGHRNLADWLRSLVSDAYATHAAKQQDARLCANPERLRRIEAGRRAAR